LRPVVAIAYAALCATAVASTSPPDDMVAVPAGRYTMGSKDGPADEQPAHEIVLERYSIDRYPVTNERFAEFLNARGPGSNVRWYDHDDPDAHIHRSDRVWKADRGYERHPAIEVTWAGARAYCAWRGKRLPTEAEWEQAARGTDGRRYPWGNESPDKSRAQFDARYRDTTRVDAHPAGASPYGVHDMAGNTWEWVSTLYLPYPYRSGDGREDARAPGVRGTRGGGHDSPAGEITTTQRGHNLSRNPLAGHHNISFRCAK
jgi:formylglycine-generating enzyme required for sulfatase activity